MTLTTKFKKDISTLQAAVNKEFYLDVKTGDELLVFNIDDDEDDDEGDILIVRK